MNPSLALMIASGALFAIAATGGDGSLAPMRGVASPAQAHNDYILKCQGCHRPDGSGDAASNPPLTGQVARFLAAQGGRDYLGRVPGVATTDLDDKRLADLLNWTLYRFDRAHVPANFKPYDAAEIGRLRKAPLRADASKTRADLVARLPGEKR